MVNRAFYQVVTRDPLASAWAIIFAVLLITLALSTAFGSEGSSMARAALVVGAMFMGFMMVARVALVTMLLAKGERAPGIVTLAATGPGTPARYHFEHEGKKHEGTVFGGGGLSEAARVTVCFDPERPENSVLLDLFV